MLLKRFWRNRDGGVGPVLALSALPLFGVVGAAIDYGRVATVRTEMQNSLDATALMLSKEAQGMSGADIGTKASAYFNALFTNPQATNIQITEEFGSPQEGNFSLKIRGSATVNTLFARLFGQSAITFSASTEVLWGIKKLNLALVLDNTGSMAQNQKMTNLKAAAHNLLTTLKNAAKQPGDVKVAIVPFATDVNVGTSNVNASWIDWTDWEAPNVPTMDESGVPGLYSSFWHGLWAPKGTPPDVLAKLNKAVVEALADPTVKQRMRDIGQEPRHSRRSLRELGCVAMVSKGCGRPSFEMRASPASSGRGRSGHPTYCAEVAFSHIMC